MFRSCQKHVQSPDRTVIIPVFQVFKNLNEGNLIFSRTGRIPFLKNLDNRVRNFPSDDNLKRYPTKFLEMCQSSVLNDKELEVDFRLLIASVSSVEGDSNSEVWTIQSSGVQVRKHAYDEFMNAKVERDLTEKWGQSYGRR